MDIHIIGVVFVWEITCDISIWEKIQGIDKCISVFIIIACSHVIGHIAAFQIGKFSFFLYMSHFRIVSDYVLFLLCYWPPRISRSFKRGTDSNLFRFVVLKRCPQDFSRFCLCNIPYVVLDMFLEDTLIFFGRFLIVAFLISCTAYSYFFRGSRREWLNHGFHQTVVLLEDGTARFAPPQMSWARTVSHDTRSMV